MQSYHESVYCMYSLELPHRSDSNEYIQYTIIILKIEKTSLYYHRLPAELTL